jgi:hypothetical protein
MADVAFFSRYGEVSRSVGFYSEPARTVAEHIFDLHRRHAAAVCRVFDRAIGSCAAELREGSLPSSCLLSLVVGQHGEDPVTGYPDRSQAADRTIMTRPEIRMAVDEKRKRVINGSLAKLKLEHQAVKDELARLKHLPPRPPQKPSGMDKSTDRGGVKGGGSILNP